MTNSLSVDYPAIEKYPLIGMFIMNLFIKVMLISKINM